MVSDGEIYENHRDHGIEARRKRAQALLADFNGLSADLFAALSVAERQVAILQDLRRVFSTSHRAVAEGSAKGCQLRQNPFFKDNALAPTPAEYLERIWPNILGTIDEVVRERKSFIKKIKGLVENMDIRRKIV